MNSDDLLNVARVVIASKNNIHNLINALDELERVLNSRHYSVDEDKIFLSSLIKLKMKIPAIIVYRSIYGSDIREAKIAVETLLLE